MIVRFMKHFRFDTICNINHGPQELQRCIKKVCLLGHRQVYRLKYHQFCKKLININMKLHFDQLATASSSSSYYLNYRLQTFTE